MLETDEICLSRNRKLDTYNISIKELEKNLIKSKINNNLPKAIIIVHFAGNPVDMIKVYKLSKKYNFNIAMKNVLDSFF